MNKKYILDTSALVSDPSAYKKYPNSEIIIPIIVLNELDDLKKHFDDAGKKARVCIRLLDEISNTGNINSGITLDHNITLKVDSTYYDLTDYKFSGFGDPTYGDTQILACLYSHWLKDDEVTLVSNDINLRIKAKARNIQAIPHDCEDVSINELYTGTQIIVNENAGVALQQHGSLDSNSYNLPVLYPNECVLFVNENSDGIAMGKRVGNKIKLIKKSYPWNLSSRNKEQVFAIDLIMDKNIDLVTLTGKAGTGKSICAQAAALELVLNKREYERLIIYRPIQPVGNSLGHLPGLLSEKLEPWFQAVMDNFEFLLGKNGQDWRRNLEMFQRKGQIELEAITYIRGRSIPNSIILIEESQNLTPDEVKTVITRAGENTKILLVGDIEQIDFSKLDAINNGLSYVVEKFKDYELAGHVTFTQGERSRLATLAADIL